MRKSLFLLLLATLCLLPGTGSAQQQYTIGAANATEVFNDVTTDATGAFIYVGSVNAGGTTDCYMVKLNAAQQVLWQRSIPNPGNDLLYRVRVCSDGNYLASGRYFQNGQGRGLVCKINSATGNIIWATTTAPMASANGDQLYDLVELANQNIVAVGSTNFTPVSVNSLVLLLNPTGGEITKAVCTFNNSDEIENITQLPNGTLVAFGHYWQGNFYDAFAFEMNSANLAITNQFHYRINIGVPGVNAAVNTLWPSRSALVNNGVMVDMVGCTGTGTGGTVQFVYTYTPGTGNLTGNYFVHNASAGGFTFSPITGPNDYIITQSNGPAAQYVSRITNGNTVYDRQIGNNRTNGINGNIVATGGNLVLAGSSPGNDAYTMFSNINFPLSGGNCPVTASTLTNVANTPTPMNNTLAMPTNNTNPAAAVALTTVTPTNILNSVCCPATQTTNVTKCNNAAITLNARAGLTYSWAPATGLSSTTIQNPVCSVNTSTTYTVTITDGTGCSYQDIINVNVIPCCPNDTTVNVTKCDIEDITLTARAGTTYSWSPATGLSSTTIQNPLCTATSSIVYTVTITDAATNCTYRDYFNVTVNSCHCEDSCNWSLTGNSFVKSYNFIGSLNNADFRIRTNNTQRAVVTAAGNVGINTPAPAKQLHVNGEARIGVLPPALPNERIVLANAAGDLHALNTTGNTNQYLSGDGTWQTFTGGGGTVTNADQGVTLDGNTVVLGDRCSRGGGGGQFQEHRVINMNNNNLYFNSLEEGKLYMGVNRQQWDGCSPLTTRLEISALGLPGAGNDYNLTTPSISGLRFTDLTARERPIPNKYNGVLSLDEEGDVIWVQSCCRSIVIDEQPQLKAMLDRIEKLEQAMKETQMQNAQLKSQVAQMDVLLSRSNTIVLNQNVPNPFAESTTITYMIPEKFGRAQLVFSTIDGVIIKTVDIKSTGKGQVNVYASDISSGLYTYTLVIDGKQIDRKKMIKQ